MIKLASLLREAEDEIIEKFISLLPKYGLEFHSPESAHAFTWRGNIYPTVTDKDHAVKVGLDRTDIHPYKGRVWVGDPSHPLKGGYVLQAIVTDPEHRGKGKAREVLKAILQAADEAGLLLKLEPVPMGDFIKRGQKKLSQPQLQKWYGKHGFEKNPEANIMTRQPKKLGEMVDLALHKIGEDPNESHSDMPIDWKKDDIQMGSPWNIPVIRKFLGLPDTFSAIYPAILEVNQLDYNLAEEDPEIPEDERGGYDWDEYRSFARRGVPPIVVIREDWGEVKLADGNHRLYWATQNGYRTIGAWVVDKLMQNEIDGRRKRKK